MFYKDSCDNELRFGDVLIDQTNIYTNVKSPKNNCLLNNLGVELETSLYSVVLTPCCSIDNDIIDIAPLVPINSHFFSNPFFYEDLTRLNRGMQPEKSVPPESWQNMTEEKKKEVLDRGFGFAFVEKFIYAPNINFKKYALTYKVNNENKTEETNYYMVDFRHITRIISKDIKLNTGMFLEKKIAQLSIDTRNELRDKIGYFYSRKPKEDQTPE